MEAFDCKNDMKTVSTTRNATVTRKSTPKRGTKTHCPLKRISSATASTSSTSRNYSISGKTPQQVQRRNERERRRVQAVNHGYEILAQQLADWDELKDKKLTKAQTLKAAILYIRHMQKLLNVSGSTTISDFKTETFADYDFINFEEVGVLESSTDSLPGGTTEDDASKFATNNLQSYDNSNSSFYATSKRSRDSYDENSSPSIYNSVGTHDYSGQSSLSDGFPIENATKLSSSPYYTSECNTSWQHFQQPLPQYLYTNDNHLSGINYTVMSPTSCSTSTTVINEVGSRSYVSPCFLPSAATASSYHSV